MTFKVTVAFTPQQIGRLIDTLSIEDKIRLVRKLENQTWARRLDNIVLKIRKRFKDNPISDKEINRVCEKTRQKLYNERNKSRN